MAQKSLIMGRISQIMVHVSPKLNQISLNIKARKRVPTPFLNFGRPLPLFRDYAVGPWDGRYFPTLHKLYENEIFYMNLYSI